jgi:NADH:ubiquinone oxidoreductase subunit F (NADH-binding)
MHAYEPAHHPIGQGLPRLLAGPALDGSPEPYHDHAARLGPLPVIVDERQLIGSLEASGLLGRGGAGFPVGRKWRGLADRRNAVSAVVLANGAEGEPWSWKDRVLMTHRPHLVIDGALLAAAAVRADEVVIYAGEDHVEARVALRRALMERGLDDVGDRAGPSVRVVGAPPRYVAGEASAAVQAIEAGDARPMTTPPRVSQRGVDGRPTLVQNVESLASAALIARFGASWYAAAGRLEARGTALITVTGAVARPGVREIELGTTIGEIADATGAAPDVQAVLLGGFFGTWVGAFEAWQQPLDPMVLRTRGLTFGCGLIAFLPAGVCGVGATAEILAWLADESAGQCGPCVFGLGAIREAADRLAVGAGRTEDLADLDRWASFIAGRGACHHPDGAAALLMSARRVFDDEFLRHAQGQSCSVTLECGDVA